MIIVVWLKFQCSMNLVGWRIGLKKNLHHLFIQLKVKPIVTTLHAFSSALRQLDAIVSSFDSIVVLSVSFLIGYSDYLGFHFTTRI